MLGQLSKPEAVEEIEKRIKMRNKMVNGSKKKLVSPIKVSLTNRASDFKDGYLYLTIEQSIALREALLEEELKVIERRDNNAKA